MFERLLKSGKEAVKHAREVAELVIRVLDRKALMKALRCDFFGTASHFLQGQQGTFSDEVTSKTSKGQYKRKSEQRSAGEFLDARPDGKFAISQAHEKRMAVESKIGR